MKFVAASLIVGALLSEASPVPTTSGFPGTPSVIFTPRPGSGNDTLASVCSLPGGDCARVVESAASIASIFNISATDGWTSGVCSAPGEACDQAREAIYDIAYSTEQIMNALLSHSDEDAVDSFVSSSFSALQRAEENSASDAITKREASNWRSYFYFCGVPGMPCKRASDAITKREASNWRSYFYFCGVPGMPCKRASDAITKREASNWRSYFYFCGVPGMPCKREASSSSFSASMTKREASNWRSYFYFCGVPGMPCKRTRRDTLVADSPTSDTTINAGGAENPSSRTPPVFRACALENNCDVAKREAMSKRGDNQAFQDIPSLALESRFNPCLEHGGECLRLRAARDAFMNIKRESEAVANLSDEEKRRICAVHGCSEEAVTHLDLKLAGDKRADAAEALCNSATGACTESSRALDQIEQALQRALSSLPGQQ